jgi:hypothetical protein
MINCEKEKVAKILSSVTPFVFVDIMLNAILGRDNGCHVSGTGMKTVKKKSLSAYIDMSYIQ